MSRYTNNDIKLTLSDLRSKIRNGVVTVTYNVYGAKALRIRVEATFGVKITSTADFNSQTLRRFEKLFDVPSELLDFGQTLKWPTQDETATALQNFINRRSDPWSHVRPVVVSQETDAPQFKDTAEA